MAETQFSTERRVRKIKSQRAGSSASVVCVLVDYSLKNKSAQLTDRLQIYIHNIWMRGIKMLDLRPFG